jgi:hypothetical protein
MTGSRRCWGCSGGLLQTTLGDCFKSLRQNLLQRCRRCGGAAAETDAHDGTASLSERLVHTRAGVQDAAKQGMRHTGNSRARWGYADAGGMPPHPPAAWGGPQAHGQTRALWYPRARMIGDEVGDPPGGVRRRTRRRLPGGHAPGQEGVDLRKVSDAGGSAGSPRPA